MAYQREWLNMSGVGQAVFMNQRSFTSPPVNTVLPVITGTAEVGQTLSVSNGTWTGTPTPTFTYQWQRVTTNISGATSSTYVLVAADAGSTIRCVVTATNVAGSANATTANTAVVIEVLELYSWGNNSSGQLGLNDTVARSSPTQIGALNNWNSVSSGAYLTAAVKNNGTLWTWGANFQGGLGQNDVVARSSPVQVGALTTWKQATAIRSSVIAVKTDGTLWAWGRDAYGLLGQNTPYTNRSSPTQIGSLTNWASVSRGGQNSCFAVKTDGTLWAWGTGTRLGQGTGVYTNRSSPVQIGALTGWSRVFGMDFSSHIFAVKTDGTLWSWGRNNDGELGLGDTTFRGSPTQVGALTTWSQAAPSDATSVAIRTNGTMWSWGAYRSGATGRGPGSTSSSPVQIGALTTWSMTASAYRSFFAIKTDGTLWSWGENSSGVLGLNDGSARNSPVQVGAQSGWTKPSGSKTQGFALQSP
jgi:alpha-tubulin suppressor-like RCC1 family protein